MCVGVIANDRGKWQLHHNENSSNLTGKCQSELREFAKGEITLLNITARLTS